MAMMLELGNIVVDVVLKDIKNVHLSVNPPSGKVRISAPQRMKLETIRLFAISKLGWIKKQQSKILGQERETPREYLNRESHCLWGKRYLLCVEEHDSPPSVTINHQKLVLRVRVGTNSQRRAECLQEWYRDQLREAVPVLLAKWEPLLRVKANGFTIRKMKTKWGSCSPSTRSIRLNTELAKKPKECLEYIVVHELIHILEPSHNARFVMFMDRFMPKWQHYREMLNRLPVRHEEWIY